MAPATTGKTADALAAYRLAGPTRRRWPPPPERPTTPATTWRTRSIASASCCRRRASRSEAEAEFRKALAIYQKLADDNPAVTEFRSGLAGSHNNLGFLLADTGKPAEAEAEYRKALAIYQKLADDNPAVTEFRSSLAGATTTSASCCGDTGKPAEAEAEYRKAMAIHQKLADDNPAVTDFRSSLAKSHHNLGYLLSTPASRRRRRPSTARRWRSGRSWPTTTPPSPNSAAAWRQPHNLGILLSNTGKPAEAEAEYRKAMAIHQKLVDDNPAVTDFRSNLARSHNNLG